MIRMILAFVISTSAVFADENLKKAFDEYNYAMTVEWDQKDPVFLEKIKTNFLNDLKHSGATSLEILRYSSSRVPDQRLRLDLNRVITALKAEQISLEDAQEILMKSVQRSMGSGASWMGWGDWIGWGIEIMIILYFWFVLGQFKF